MSTEPLCASPDPDVPNQASAAVGPAVGHGQQPQQQQQQQQQQQYHAPMYHPPQGQAQGQQMYAPQPAYYPYPPPQGQPMYAPPQAQGQGQPVYTQQQPVYVDAQGRPIQHAPGQPMYTGPTQVVAVPYQGQAMIPMVNAWQTDFCDMCNDMDVCCLTAFCPCIQYGYNQEMLDGSDCVTHCCIYWLVAYCVGCPCLVHFCQREKLRQKFGLREDCGPDLFATCCCPACAICQEARELKIRNGVSAPPNEHMM